MCHYSFTPKYCTRSMTLSLARSHQAICEYIFPWSLWQPEAKMSPVTYASARSSGHTQPGGLHDLQRCGREGVSLLVLGHKTHWDLVLVPPSVSPSSSTLRPISLAAL